MPPASTLVPTPPAAEATLPFLGSPSSTMATRSRHGLSSCADFAKVVGLLRRTSVGPALLALATEPPRVPLLDLGRRKPLPAPPTARCTAPRQTPDLPRAGCPLRVGVIAPRPPLRATLPCRLDSPDALVGPPPRAQFVYIIRGSMMTTCTIALPPPPMRSHRGPSLSQPTARPRQSRRPEPTPRSLCALPAPFGWMFPRRLFTVLLRPRLTAWRRLFPDADYAASNASLGTAADAPNMPGALGRFIPLWPLTRHPHTPLLAMRGCHPRDL